MIHDVQPHLCVLTLSAELIDRITDSNEHVRAEICGVFAGLDFETTLRHISIHTLKAISGRVSDKKVSFTSRGLDFSATRDYRHRSCSFRDL